jgi:hypothetical protein
MREPGSDDVAERLLTVSAPLSKPCSRHSSRPSVHHRRGDSGEQAVIVPHRLKIVMDDPATVTQTGSVPALSDCLKTP